MDDPLLGHTLAGRFTLRARIRGEEARGQYRAEDPDGASYLVTTGFPQSKPLPVVEDELALEYLGVAPLVHTGPLEVGSLSLDVIVELEPEGTALDTDEVRAPEEVVAIGLGVAAILKEMHAGGDLAWGLRPELVYAAGGAVTRIAPRCERFWSTAQHPSYGLDPGFAWTYIAPEIIQRGEVGPPCDVFSLCAMLAQLATGEHPFDARGDRPLANVTHDRMPWSGPAALGAVLDGGLERDPRGRVSLGELVDALAAYSPK